MAHVAISRDFIARVQGKIEVMKRAEVAALGQCPSIQLPVDSDIVARAVWREHLHLKDKIPQKWKGKNNTCRLVIQTKSTLKNSDGVDVPVNYRFEVKAPTDKHFEYPPGHYWHDEENVVPDELMNRDDIKAAVAYGNALTEVNQRWNDVTNKVITFFNSCKSMKEAVTLWPECRMYIDSDDIRRFETKVVKTASQDSNAAKVLATIGADELVGAAIAARFQGAK